MTEASPEPVPNSNLTADAKPTAACKLASMSGTVAKSIPTINFQKLICIHLSWVGLPYFPKFQPKHPGTLRW